MKQNPFFYILIFPYLLSGFESLPVAEITMKAEALYWPKQKIRDSERVADKLGYYEMPGVMKKNPPALLVDGKNDWNHSVRTYFWSNQPKRIEAVLDLGKTMYVDSVEVYQGGTRQKGNLIEKIEVSGALQNDGTDCWDTPRVQEQKILAAPAAENAYPLTFRFARKYRYIRVICSSQASAMMVLSEIRVMGSETSETTLPEKTLPADTFRFEAEAIDSTFKLSKPELLGGSGIFITASHNVDFALPAELQGKTLYSHLRYLDNGNKTVEFSLNGKSIAMPSTGGCWQWRRGPEVPEAGPVVSCLLRKKKSEHGLVDSLILTASADFDPAENDEPMFLKTIPLLKKEELFAWKLLRERPDISPEEFGRRIAEHHGIVYRKPALCVDEYNNPLVNGKPFFQLGFYHVQPDDKRLEEVKVNTFITTSKVNREWGKPEHKAVISHLASLRAYDEVAERLKNYAHDRIAMHYICDEPDGHINITLRDLELLNAVVKAVCPDNATFLNFAANSTMHKAFRITDVIGLDHYPVPAGRIADIAYTMDAMRYFSGNRPVVFVPQAFSWGGYNRADGRFPTPDELCAMTMLGLVHGAKGILFYEFPAPKMSSRTSIKEINPVLWERLCKLIGVIDFIKPELLGPDFALPAKVETPPAERRAEFRVIADPAYRKCRLLAVNPWENPIRCNLNFSGGPLRNLNLKPFMAYGASAEQSGKNEESFHFRFEPFGSAVFLLEAEGLSQLKARTSQEVLAELKPIFERNENQADAVLPLNGTPLDLLDSWRSLKRPDSALLRADGKGISIEAVIRFPVGAKSICRERDGRVWNDPALELFLSMPNHPDYVHLMVNTDNIQADWKFDPTQPKPVDKNMNFQWNSKVDYNGEVATFHVFIPWDSMKKMTGAVPGDLITFNMASSTALLDWVGLTGSGFHAPARFGRIRLGSRE